MGLNQITFFVFSALAALLILPDFSWAVEVNDVAENIVTSSAELPGLITGLAYALGLLLGVTGILKIREHVENPNSAPLRVGLIRLLSGGALFALPIVYEAMETAINAGVEGELDLDSTAGGSISAIFGRISSLGVTFNISNIAANIIDAIEDVPALITAFAYIVGLYMGVQGILKIKDHVEDPTRAEMKDGVGRLLIGGAFFALPTIFSAMLNAISGGGIGFGGQATSILSGFSMAYSSETGSMECLSIPIISGLFGKATFGNAVCNLISASAALPSFLEAIAYLMGLVFGFWGLLKIRDHILQPQQNPAWDGIIRLLVGGMFLALPYMIEVVRSTITPGNLIVAGTVVTNTGFNDGAGGGHGGGILGGLIGAATGFVSSIVDALGFGGGCAPIGKDSSGGLDTMLTCFMSDIFGPVHVLLNFFGFLAGMTLIMIGLSRLMKSTQEGGKGPIGLGTLMTLFTGGALLSFNGLIRGFSTSIFGSPITKTYATLSYTDGADGAFVQNSYAIINSVTQFLILIGLISFMRGLFILRSAAEGGQQASIMAGITHIIGGTLAVNLGPVINAVQGTLGIGVIQFS